MGKSINLYFHVGIRPRSIFRNYSIVTVCRIFCLDIKVKGGADGVHLITDRDGRPSGDAFVELETAEGVEQSLALDHQHMGKRYIEGAI